MRTKGTLINDKQSSISPFLLNDIPHIYEKTVSLIWLTFAENAFGKLNSNKVLAYPMHNFHKIFKWIIFPLNEFQNVLNSERLIIYFDWLQWTQSIWRIFTIDRYYFNWIASPLAVLLLNNIITWINVLDKIKGKFYFVCC